MYGCSLHLRFVEQSICSSDTDSDATASHSLEEVDVCKFLHLVNITFGFDDLLVIEQDPCLFVLGCVRQSLANERHIMSR